jgi:hypothetical protein
MPPALLLTSVTHLSLCVRFNEVGYVSFVAAGDTFGPLATLRSLRVLNLMWHGCPRVLRANLDDLHVLTHLDALDLVVLRAEGNVCAADIATLLRALVQLRTANVHFMVLWALFFPS